MAKSFPFVPRMSFIAVFICYKIKTQVMPLVVVSL